MSDRSIFEQLYNAIIAGDRSGLEQAVEDASGLALPVMYLVEGKIK